MILFHGGGWSGGTLAQFRAACAYFASRGLVCATAEYQMLGKGERQAARGRIEKTRLRHRREKRDPLVQTTRRRTRHRPRPRHHRRRQRGRPHQRAGHHEPRPQRPRRSQGHRYQRRRLPVVQSRIFAGDHKDPEIDILRHMKADLPPAIVFFGDKDTWKKAGTCAHAKWKELGAQTIDLRIAEGQPHGFFNRIRGAPSPSSRRTSFSSNTACSPANRPSRCPPAAPAYITKAALANQEKDRQGRLRGPSWENGGDVPDDTYDDGQIATKAVEKLKALAAAEKPFLLAVGFMKPHLPFVAPGAYFDKFPADKVRMPDNYFPPKNAPKGAVHGFGELRNYSDIPKKGILPEDKALELIRGYHASTSYTDAQIGRLLDAFDELGLAENTVIVFWGDHGWNLGEHTMWCKHSCFETSVRAPLIFTAPEAMGLKSGSSTRSLAEFIDIYPTLCDLTNLPKPGHLQGNSLIPVLKDPSASVNDAAISRFQDGDTIRTDRYRYTIYRNPKGKQTGHMLYDHEVDPGENTNIADDPAHAGTVAKLAKQLEAGMGRPGDFKNSN
jgi:hypothetical protein